jgi:hypothetical protein
MGAIFAFSSTPSTDLPNFGWIDTLVKKGGHMLGYGLLALSYYYGLSDHEGDDGVRRKLRQGGTPKTLVSLILFVFSDSRILAWLLAMLYAVTDEFHQSFIPGRHPSAWDVALFDATGALLALWFWNRYSKGRRESKNATAG